MSDSEAKRFDAQAESTAVLVLGMHRSGTSATAGALGVLGVPLGSRLLDAGLDNTGGYWEHRDAVVLDERLLDALGMDWDDPRELPSNWLDSEAAMHAGEQIRALISDEFRETPLWALKDPRMCRLLPLWRHELAAQNVQATALLVLRHPDEIAASLLARDAMSPVVTHLLSIRYLLEAERATRGLRRSVVRYERILEEPFAAFSRIAVDLGLLWPQPPTKCGSALDAFLDAGARHHVVAASDDATRREPGIDSPLRDVALELHALLDRGVTDPATLLALDRFRNQFEAGLAIQKTWLDMLYAECRLRSVLRKKIDAQHADTRRNLQRRLDDTESALARAESLCFDRLHEVEKLDQALGAMQRAHEEAASLAIQRMYEIEKLDQALGVAQRAHEEAIQRAHECAELDARNEALSARLSSMLGTRSWRITKPLRDLASWYRRMFSKDSGS